MSRIGHALIGIARALNLRALKKTVSLLVHDPSGRELGRALLGWLRALRDSLGSSWRPASFVEEKAILGNKWSDQLLVTCHLHYVEYLPRFFTLVGRFPDAVSFAVTTSSQEIRSRIEEKKLPNVSVYQSENRGRNFGPLLVELAKIASEFEFVVHLHSKESKHSPRKYAKRWTDAHWDLLGEDVSLFGRLMDILLVDEDIAIAYPLVTDLVPPSSFNWGPNETLARHWFEGFDGQFVEGQFPFPAGGMFIFRPSAFSALLSQNWQYGDFPSERGQLDGTAQHMLERLFGALAISQGLKHLVYVPSEGKFTTDCSYPQVRRLVS